MHGYAVTGHAVLVSNEDERRQQLEELAQALRTFDHAGHYFAATLLAQEGKWSLRFDTTFAGWPEGVEPGPTAPELREPCPVEPAKMVALWESVGHGWLAVDHPAELAAYFRLGGNALIAQGVARTHLAHFIAPQVLVNPALVGFAASETAMNKHRPSQKLRLRILKRDGYRCQLCGERPSLNEHIVLVVHHINPFGASGVTAAENLITICHTCHGGLDPHEDWDLSSFQVATSTGWSALTKPTSMRERWMPTGDSPGERSTDEPEPRPV